MFIILANCGRRPVRTQLQGEDVMIEDRLARRDAVLIGTPTPAVIHDRGANLTRALRLAQDH